MKRTFLLIAFAVISISAYSQVPYFGATVGDNKVYSYTALKFRPGINTQEFFTTFEYGIGNHFATGWELYSADHQSYVGVHFRTGKKFSKWLSVGAETTPAFNINDNMKFSYLQSGLYLNGAITQDGRFFWTSNTWWTVYKDSEFTLNQWWYLAYTIPTIKEQSITPMLGALHSWKMNQDVDLAAGIYYTIKNWNFYLWGNDFFKEHPRVVVAVDVTF